MQNQNPLLAHRHGQWYASHQAVLSYSNNTCIFTAADTSIEPTGIVLDISSWSTRVGRIGEQSPSVWETSVRQLTGDVHSSNTRTPAQFIYPDENILGGAASSADSALSIVENGITKDWDAAAQLLQGHVRHS